MNGLEASQRASSSAQPEPPSEDVQGLSRKKVVRVVRKVVRKVLPGEDPGSAKEPLRDIKSPEPGKKAEKSPLKVLSPPPRPSSSLKAEPKEAVPKDDLSVGLKSLMSRGKTKEHRPRAKLPEKKEEKLPEKVKTPPLVEGKAKEARDAQEPKGLAGLLVKTAPPKVNAADKVSAHRRSTVSAWGLK